MLGESLLHQSYSLNLRVFLAFACAVLLAWETASAQSQPSLAIPATPRGDMATEALQSLSYCRALKRTLAVVEKNYPQLRLETTAARASWESSPFAIACDNIETEIRKDAGEQGAALLGQIDEAQSKELATYDVVGTEEKAREFLKLVDRRAKGEMEVDMVSGTLLWNHKPYQNEPGREFRDGFTRSVEHTSGGSSRITFDAPMSWKRQESPEKNIMSFQNCWGHGNVWMTVLVLPTTNSLGRTIPAEEKFEAYGRDSLKEEYERLGITLTSFMKTKVRNMPALFFTREQPFEELGSKATRAAEVIRVFVGTNEISFQINTLGPEGQPTAANRIKKNQELFKMIGGSLRVMDL